MSVFYAAFKNFENPKSQTLYAIFLLVIGSLIVKTLSGFISRWIMFFECKNHNPDAIDHAAVFISY